MNKKFKIIISIIMVILIIIGFILYQMMAPCKKISNKRTLDANIVTCHAEPHLWKNLFTGECIYTGCGYGPYNFSRPGWIRIQ
jgi:hypothetical protein